MDTQLFALIDGEIARKDRVLKDGELLKIFPYITGGWPHRSKAFSYLKREAAGKSSSSQIFRWKRRFADLEAQALEILATCIDIY
jgi:hypothetical protein